MTDPKPSIADSLNVSAYDESMSANLDRAAAATPVVGNFWTTGKSIAQHAQEIGAAENFEELGIASAKLIGDGGSFLAGAALDVTFFAMDPIGWLVSSGLNMLLELVQPLQDALHSVSGDGPAIGHASDNFTTIAQGFVALADDFETTGDEALASWANEAGEAAKAALGDFSTGIRGLGSSAGSVAEVLQMWSMVMVVIEEVIKAIISELVSWLITIWLPALASSVISFGGSVAAAMTASIAKAASVFAKVTRHLGKLGKLLDEFMAFLVKYSGKIERITEKFRVGKVIPAGKRVGLFGHVTDRDVWVPSRRVITTVFGTQAGVGPLFTGMGIKAGIGILKGGGKEGKEEVYEDGPIFNESQIGGDHSYEETRDNLDM